MYLCEINKNNSANAAHGQRLVQEMFRTKLTSDWFGPGQAREPVLTVPAFHSTDSMQVTNHHRSIDALNEMLYTVHNLK